MKAAVLEHFADWAPALRRLVAEADGPLVPRPVHALPEGHRWEPDGTGAALAAYEARLFPRARQKARESARGLDALFHDDAPQPLLDLSAPAG